MKVIPNLSNNEYHAHPAVSKSVLDRVSRSPLHARAYLDGYREEPTAAMQFGTALHTAVLEPVVFANQYVVFDGDRRTKAGKEAYELLVSSGASIISRSDYDAISAMAKAIRNHSVAGRLLTEGKAEHSVFWTDPITGLECKCRPDWWNGSMLVDLKTTEDASPEGFARSIANYRYHVQAAFYMQGTGATRFLFVAVEKKPPYAVAVYELDADSLDVGHALRMRDLTTYASCIQERRWPGYSDRIETLSLPGWAFPAEEENNVEVSYV